MEAGALVRISARLDFNKVNLAFITWIKLRLITLPLVIIHEQVMQVPAESMFLTFLGSFHAPVHVETHPSHSGYGVFRKHRRATILTLTLIRLYKNPISTY
jgi:hypothetical protein